jgi:hypothetical protein
MKINLFPVCNTSKNSLIIAQTDLTKKAVILWTYSEKWWFQFAKIELISITELPNWITFDWEFLNSEPILIYDISFWPIKYVVCLYCNHHCDERLRKKLYSTFCWFSVETGTQNACMNSDQHDTINRWKSIYFRCGIHLKTRWLLLKLI